MKKEIPFTLIISSIAFCLLLSPASFSMLCFFAVIGFCLGVLLCCMMRLEGYRCRSDAGGVRKTFVLSIVLSVVIIGRTVYFFISTWMVSSLVRNIAGVFGISNRAFLAIAGLLAGVLAFKSVLAIMLFALDYNSLSKESSFSVLTVLQEESCGFFILFVFVEHFQLQFSAINEWTGLFQMDWRLLILNTFLLIILNLFIIVVVGHVTFALLISALLSMVLGLVNHYTIMLHGSPLFFSELANLRTAADVLSGYSLSIDRCGYVLIVLFIVNLMIVFMGVKNVRPIITDKRVKCGRIGICILSIIFIVVLYSVDQIRPKVTMGWSWTSGVQDYGYISCIYEDIYKRINYLTKPEGYSVDRVDLIPVNNSNSGYSAVSQAPDIILILNESFYDLGRYTDIELDNDPFSGFYQIEGAAYGYACQPLAGGGTNNTEFELLTSNSLYLLPIGAPFNYVDFSKNINQAGKVFQNLGYQTVGMHCAVPSNYNRHNVYPFIGFDDIYLGKDKFKYFDSYGNRPWTDSGNYKDLEAVYEELGESPRFIYMLTYQNHAGFDQNNASFDTVHVLTDYGDINEEINEYLTGISMSTKAFLELVECFRDSSRPIIICMLGDHAPSMIEQLPAKEGMSEYDKIITKQTVPYVVWSNTSILWPEGTDYISVVDIVPLLKQVAGLSLSTYDNILLDIQKIVPIRFPNGLYRTADGETGVFDIKSNNHIDMQLRNYLFAEYNLLKGGKELRKELFEP